MNLIYLHGFRSNPFSAKGQLLRQALAQRSDIQVHLPDLNAPPREVMQHLSALIEQLDQVALVGSSLGGFYATQLVARYAVPAVLINPAMRPWQLFQELFGDAQIPLKVHEHWTLERLHLQQLEQMAVPFVEKADKILVLLQQGDEVLDYRDAQRYYSQAQHSSLIMTETRGNHGMDNFALKIPMQLQFLSDSLK